MIIPIRVLKDCLSIAAKAESRYSINAIRLSRIGPIACRAEATDGKRLIRFAWDEPEEKVLPYGANAPEGHPALPEPVADAELLVPRWAVRELLRAHKPSSAMRRRFPDGVGYVVIADTVLAGEKLDASKEVTHRVLVVDGDGPRSETVTVNTLRFPDTNGLVESVNRQKLTAKFNVNAHIMAELLQAVAAGDRDGGNGSLHTEVELRGEQLIFSRRTVDGFEVEALIMTMHGS